MEGSTSLIQSWPEPVLTALRGAFGEPSQVDALGGMSGAGVHRIHCGNISVIVKGEVGANEAWFYRAVAPVLARRGVASPDCHWNEAVDGARWLILEDISEPLPPERHLADPAVLAMLRRLHQTPVACLPPVPDAFRPVWSSKATEAALTRLSPAAAEAVKPKLEQVREATQPLFAAEGIISGDPNPANWGVRANGEPVLFDWDRFGFGAPALDLAITVPGLGDAAAFRQVATTYLETEDSQVIDELARTMGPAKVWTIVELLAGVATGEAHPPAEVIDWLVGRLPNWLDEIV